MSNETCDKCRFWHKGINVFEGYCQRNPPVLNVQKILHYFDLRDIGNADPRDDADSWIFPVTERGWWCGEWQPRKA